MNESSHPRGDVIEGAPHRAQARRATMQTPPRRPPAGGPARLTADLSLEPGSLELLQHADQLLVDELLDAVSTELPAEARSLDAAEWQLGPVGAHPVDVDHSRI